MKKSFTFLCFLLLSQILFSQIVDTLYLKETDKYSTKKNFDYYKVIEKINKNSYSIKDYYKGDSLKTTCEYFSDKEIKVSKKNFEKLVRRNKLLPNGRCINYCKSNLIEGETIYDKGEIVYGPVEYINGDTLYFNADVMPIYTHNGINGFREFIATSLVYPIEAFEQGIQGQILTRFTINKEGVVEDIKIIRSAHKLLDEEAIRVLSTSPKWIPGKHKGKPVKVGYNFPINFSLDG